MTVKKADLSADTPSDVAVTPAPASTEPAALQGEEQVRRPLPGEATDPHVHHLLGIRQAHSVTLRSNPDEANRALAEATMAEIDERLAALGYEVG